MASAPDSPSRPVIKKDATRVLNFVAKQRANPLFLQALAIGFTEADTDGDSVLSYDEFVAAIPPKVRDDADDDTLREVFDMADVDGNGSISPDEFFFWTLQFSADHSGFSWSSMESAFRQYDTTKDGMLNLLEFTKAVEPFGYGEVAHAVFAELDRDHSGTICYKDIMATLKQMRAMTNISPECRKLLTAMSFSKSKPETVEVAQLDRTPFTCDSSKDLLHVLRERMKAAGARPFDVWNALLSSTFAVSRKNLVKLNRGDFFKYAQRLT